MRHFYLFVLLTLLAASAWAQAPAPEVYAKATIKLTAKTDMRRLAALGLEVDHGIHTPSGFTSYFSTRELDKIRAAGFGVEVLVADAAADFRTRNQAGMATVQDVVADPDCDNLGRYPIPRHWHYGHMGGHLTYAEAMAQLDSMRLLYPSLITARATIDTIRTLEGRPCTGCA